MSNYGVKISEIGSHNRGTSVNLGKQTNLGLKCHNLSLDNSNGVIPIFE